MLLPRRQTAVVVEVIRYVSVITPRSSGSSVHSLGRGRFPAIKEPENQNPNTANMQSQHPEVIAYSSPPMARAASALVIGFQYTTEQPLTVDLHLAVCNNLLDDASLLKVSQGLAGQAAVDLETIDEDGNGDQAVGLDILVELVGDGLVEKDGVVGLVLDCIFCQSEYFSTSQPSSSTHVRLLQLSRLLSRTISLR